MMPTIEFCLSLALRSSYVSTTPRQVPILWLYVWVVRSESLMRWVWEANRGNPVGENATFSLGTNGNLVLADADGRVAWQSDTADKGVVGFQLLPNGNMSFDSPTDTLLVGQALHLKGPNKLVSWLSKTENKDGAYSLVLEPNRFVLYYATKNSPRPILYFDATDYLLPGKLDVLTFNSQPETEDAFAYEITLENPNGGTRILSRPKYNSTLTYLRLGIDGGLRAYTFYDKVDWGAWEETFTLCPRDSGEECQLPERCGSFGLCEDSQCVACPSPNGLLGWSKSCAPPKLTSCKPNDIKYYKLEGVDHFLSKYTRGSGPVKEEACSRKCTSDCKCLGFFFNRAESRCWIAYELKTLTRVANSTHVGYIKTPAR
ncbi:UNVERIFIED_CONTAM: EP1-like glycoprotein 3 [Sesamum radiatum]|uniref:EP1-like glycoprotein 3 n=1 Tax=Sesamum radiatum TaxID=300843 RepID=A0AAW2T4B7_SESRA